MSWFVTMFDVWAQLTWEGKLGVMVKQGRPIYGVDMKIVDDQGKVPLESFVYLCSKMCDV